MRSRTFTLYKISANDFILQILILPTALVMDISVAVGMEGAKKILEEVEFVMSINRQIVQTSGAVVPTPENNILGKHATQRVIFTNEVHLNCI